MDAVRALEKAGFRIVRQGKHIVMSDGARIVTIPRHNPVNAFTMGGIARDASLSVEQFRELRKLEDRPRISALISTLVIRKLLPAPCCHPSQCLREQAIACQHDAQPSLVPERQMRDYAWRYRRELIR